MCNTSNASCSMLNAFKLIFYPRVSLATRPQLIKDPHRATHGQGEADPSTATGGSKPCVTK